jgi:prepilin-type N-terminal cleavage/methylation domain-containing protein
MRDCRAAEGINFDMPGFFVYVMSAFKRLLYREGLTLIEMLVVMTMISVIAAVLLTPQISRFNANYRARSCATDLIQNLRNTRAMAIKESREYLVVFDTDNLRYLIGFDADSDDDLMTVSDADNGDTYGLCKDTNNNRIPDEDSDDNNDGVPDCVRVFELADCGSQIRFGTLAPNGPDPDNPNNDLCANGLGVCFGNTQNPIRTVFNPNGSAGILGKVFIDHNNNDDTGRRYSYVVKVSTNAGTTNMFKWDGDEENPSVETWTEIR